MGGWIVTDAIDTKTVTEETIHGAIEYEVIECCNCGSEYLPRHAVPCSVAGDDYVLCENCIESIYGIDVDAENVDRAFPPDTSVVSEPDRSDDQEPSLGTNIIEPIITLIVMAITVIVAWHVFSEMSKSVSATEITKHSTSIQDAFTTGLEILPIAFVVMIALFLLTMPRNI